MPIAAMWGTTVGYVESEYDVIIETTDGRVRVTGKNTFDSLYYRLDEFTAALKEDCIEYVILQSNIPLACYPDWFIDAYDDGWIVNDGYPTPRCPDGGYTFYDVKSGEIPMSPESVVLRNYIGELMYMELYQFNKYYDTVGEWENGS